MDYSDFNEAQLQAMALLATLRTAAEVCEVMSLRRQGRDPSDQESPIDALEALRESRQHLTPIVRRLRVRSLLADEDSHDLVQQFEDRMLLARSGRILHLMHQRLLSLFPIVEAELPERTRLLQVEAARLATSDESAPFIEALGSWSTTVTAVLHDLDKHLYTAN